MSLTIEKRDKITGQLLFSVPVPLVVETNRTTAGAVDAYVEARVASEKGPVLAGVPFTSDKAAKAAKAAGLDAWDFERRPRAEHAGFSLDEVKALVLEKKPEEQQTEAAHDGQPPAEG